jgi:hypothetical protein
MDIIHRLMMIKIHDVSETEICLRHQVTGEGTYSDGHAVSLLTVSGKLRFVALVWSQVAFNNSEAFILK